jgi:hypothetical protein
MNFFEVTPVPDCQSLDVFQGIDGSGNFYQSLRDSREELKQQLFERGVLVENPGWASMNASRLASTRLKSVGTGRESAWLLKLL